MITEAVRIESPKERIGCFPKLHCGRGLLATLQRATIAFLISNIMCRASEDVVLMSYFRDNGNAGTFLCASEDGLKFRPLNGGKPVLPPGKWPGQGRTRDPSIVYHGGKFRAVWTTNWTGRVFGYAESVDLVKWSEPVLVSPFPDACDPKDVPKSVWAPEIHWDPLQKNHLILWSSNTPRSGGFRTFASRTSDGRTFTPAKLFFDPGIAVIDAQMLLKDPVASDSSGAQWLMVVKDERSIKKGGKNLHLTTAPMDFSQPWKPLSPPVIGPGSTVRPEEQVEGGCLLRFGGEYRLYCDAFASGHYVAAKSVDLISWTDVTSQLELPKGVRHGTVFTAPRAAVGWLKREAPPATDCGGIDQRMDGRKLVALARRDYSKGPWRLPSQKNRPFET